MPTVEPIRPRLFLPDGAPPQTPPRPAPALPPAPAMDQAVDANVVAAAQRFDDRVLYLGMNRASVPVESWALGASVTVLAGSSSHEVTLAGASHDVSTPAGVRGFVQGLAAANRLSPRQCQDLEGIILACPESGRDEVARLAAAWAPAERGEAIPSRLVLSGHSSLGLLWGDDDTGLVHLQAVRDLGRVLPRAAAQIEDIHVSGCFSEGEVQHADRWTASFPNARTIWGYSGFAPHAAASDLSAWEIATRGRATRIDAGLVAAHGSATAWSIGGGIVGSSASAAERRERVAEADTRFDAYFSGRARIPDPHDPAADRVYGAYQMLASHQDATPAERAQATERGAQMLRLRFWESSVRGEIASHHGAQINRALEKAGLEPVDFRTLSRQAALATIAAYREATGAVGPIMQGIERLSPDVIPASYCH